MHNRSIDTISLDFLKGNDLLNNEKLKKAGLNTVQDLLLYLPSRYVNYNHLCIISDLLPGIYSAVEGEILNCNIIFKKRQMIVCQISDGSGILTLRFFNFNIAMKNSLSIKKRIWAYGEVQYGKNGVEMIHPKYRILNNIRTIESKKTLTPIYPTTKGIKQKTFLKLTDQALSLLKTYTISELLPPEVTKDMISLKEALFILHRPPLTLQSSDLKNSQHPARQRLIIEELLAYYLSFMISRNSIQQLHAQELPQCNDNLKNKLLASLSFKLTNAQLRVMKEIERDMALNIPMMRLIQGDVGSGKTLIAALAALRAVAHDKQVALIVPTELLAKQHVNNFYEWFSPLGIKVECLTGKQKRKLRVKQQKSIASGEIKIIIGTHAIFHKKIQFKNLALIIIDEQHRFGVHQRLILREKSFHQGFYPHQLIMTATPIPRTLAMTSYANLNISTIDELPSGRTPVITAIIPDTRRDDIIQRIHNVCIKEERQVYWVCTLVKQSKKLLKIQAAETIWLTLQSKLPDLKIGLVHGGMKSIEKEKIIQNFKAAKLHLLVTTTIIEVGVHVSNASLMIIENSERLGLAQLHQLRGRIGRDTKQSYCILLYKSPLTENMRKRLQILRNSNDGFLIAQKDLEVRGFGELLGTRQAGNFKFKVANLLRDWILIPKIKYIARYILNHYPEQAEKLITRWMSKNNRYFHA